MMNSSSLSHESKPLPNTYIRLHSKTFQLALCLGRSRRNFFLQSRCQRRQIVFHRLDPILKIPDILQLIIKFLQRVRPRPRSMLKRHRRLAQLARRILHLLLVFKHLLHARVHRSRQRFRQRRHRHDRVPSHRIYVRARALSIVSRRSRNETKSKFDRKNSVSQNVPASRLAVSLCARCVSYISRTSLMMVRVFVRSFACLV